MTTKVQITCPDNSHWHVKFEVQDLVYDHDKQRMTDEWKTVESHTRVLKQGEQAETYLTSSRRLILTEVEKAKD